MSPSQDFLKCIEKIEKILLFINTPFEFEMLMLFVYGARKVANYVLFLKQKYGHLSIFMIYTTLSNPSKFFFNNLLKCPLNCFFLIRKRFRLLILQSVFVSSKFNTRLFNKLLPLNAKQQGVGFKLKVNILNFFQYYWGYSWKTSQSSLTCLKSATERLDQNSM